jgi:copper/silver efflux system protein
MMQEMDMRIASIPEVSEVVGKIGRVDLRLTRTACRCLKHVINYHSEFKTDDAGEGSGSKLKTVSLCGMIMATLFLTVAVSFYRQWRDHIRSTDDIWTEVLHASDLPGVTSAPKLHPIETRLVMLQTGMRANMGVRISGPDLETIDEFATDLERKYAKWMV